MDLSARHRALVEAAMPLIRGEIDRQIDEALDDWCGVSPEQAAARVDLESIGEFHANR